VLQEKRWTLVADLAVPGRTIEGFEVGLGVQRGPELDEDTSFLLVGIVPPPVRGAGRDGRLFSLPELSLLVAYLDTKDTGEGLETLLLVKMNVQRVFTVG